MSHQRVQDVRTEVKEGDQILVKVVNIDPSGKIRLSRKALLEGGDAAGAGAGGQGEPQPAGAYSDRGSSDSHRDRPRGDRDRGRGGDRGGRGGRPR
jgi:polyribonucleotide nucleotidyltransferase